MKKQISYATFMTRVFSTVFDIALFGMFLAIFQSFLGFIITLFYTQQPIEEKSPYILVYYLIYQLIQLALLFAYAFSFWHYFSATPAKILLRLKIVDSQTLKKPSTYQFLIRFLASFTFPIGIWFAFFSKQKQTLSDIISKTLVIKS
jgi:uncharacterized RDD family membrane protein YckC